MAKEKQILKVKIVLIYLLIGIGFGLCFPIGAIILESFIKGVPLTIVGISVMHAQNPLLYMIDTAPLILGLFSMFGGFSKAKTELTNHSMNQVLQEMEEAKIVNEKLMNDYKIEHDKMKALNQKIGETSRVLFENSDNLNETMDELSQSDKQINGIIMDMDSHVEELEATTSDLVSQFGHYNIIIENMRESTEVTGKEIDEHLRIADILLKEIELSLSVLKAIAEKTIEVGSIIDMIDSISSKVKMLALNASIESARAGEVGKGFAVVANEIKALSEQTEEATNQISTTIQSLTMMVDEVKTKIDVMNDNGAQLMKSNERVSSDFQNLTKDILQVEHGSKIAAKQMNEQSLTLSSMNDRIRQVAGFTQQRNQQMELSHQALSVNEQQIEILNGHL